jgi:hypothetical protein
VFVEYALGVSLICVVLIASLNSLQSKAGDHLATRGNAIGHPGEGGATTTTAAVPPGPTSTTSTTVGGYVGTVSGGCTGGGNDAHTCAFTLAPTPPTPAVWSIEPSIGYTGTAQNPTFTTPGERSVRATVDGSPSFQATVVCTSKGSKLDCVVS